MKLVKLAKESDTQGDKENYSTRWAHWLVLDSEQRVVGELRTPNFVGLEVVEEPEPSREAESTP